MWRQYACNDNARSLWSRFSVPFLLSSYGNSYPGLKLLATRSHIHHTSVESLARNSAALLSSPGSLYLDSLITDQLNSDTVVCTFGVGSYLTHLFAAHGHLYQALCALYTGLNHPLCASHFQRHAITTLCHTQSVLPCASCDPGTSIIGYVVR
jgi:hypothetical protein